MGKHRASGLPRILPPVLALRVLVGTIAITFLGAASLFVIANAEDTTAASVNAPAMRIAPEVVVTESPLVTGFKLDKIQIKQAQWRAEREERIREAKERKRRAAMRASRAAERKALEEAQAEAKARAEARAKAQAEAEAKRKAEAEAKRKAARPSVSSAPCRYGSSIESGLTSNAIKAYRAVCAAFPSITTYGGYRAEAGSYHATGQAVDIMVSGDLGWAVATFLRNNAGALGVSEVIYAQRIWTVQRSGEGWRWMEDRGSTTQNHYDHVHVSVY